VLITGEIYRNNQLVVSTNATTSSTTGVAQIKHVNAPPGTYRVEIINVEKSGFIWDGVVPPEIPDRTLVKP